MKKLILILSFVCANFAGAQEVVESTEYGGVTFFDIISSSGIIGIIIWIIVFTMWPVGIVLGIISCIMSALKKTGKIPFPFKLLITMPLFYVFIASVGLMHSMIMANQGLSAETGAAHARALALNISNVLYIPALTLLGMLPFLFFIFLSIIIFHVCKASVTAKKTEDDGGES